MRASSLSEERVDRKIRPKKLQWISSVCDMFQSKRLQVGKRRTTGEKTGRCIDWKTNNEGIRRQYVGQSTSVPYRNASEPCVAHGTESG